MVPGRWLPPVVVAGNDTGRSPRPGECRSSARNGHLASGPTAVFDLKGDDWSNLCVTTSLRMDRLRRRRNARHRWPPHLDLGRARRGSSREQFSTRSPC